MQCSHSTALKPGKDCGAPKQPPGIISPHSSRAYQPGAAPRRRRRLPPGAQARPHARGAAGARAHAPLQRRRERRQHQADREHRHAPAQLRRQAPGGRGALRARGARWCKPLGKTLVKPWSNPGQTLAGKAPWRLSASPRAHACRAAAGPARARPHLCIRILRRLRGRAKRAEAPRQAPGRSVVHGRSGGRCGAHGDQGKGVHRAAAVLGHADGGRGRLVALQAGRHVVQARSQWPAQVAPNLAAFQWTPFSYAAIVAPGWPSPR